MGVLSSLIMIWIWCEDMYNIDDFEVLNMKVLVYGTGVIGSLTVHELIAAGNDVTVVSRGHTKDRLEKNGLRIRSGKKEFTDHPRVLPEYDGQAYDVTFSVMQNQQQDKLLDTLAGVHTKYLVLVGNNMESGEMDRILRGKSTDQKTVLFGFQSSGGLRHENYTDVVIFGILLLTIGHLKKELETDEKADFKTLFHGSRMKLDFEDDMESWYRCHAAFIIPVACISYIYHCNVRTCSWNDISRYIKAGSEAYGFLMSIGTQIRPKGDEKNLRGIRGGIMTLLMWIMFKTKLGEDGVSNHCRNAVTEMQFLDEKFEELRKRNRSFPMPVYDRLRQERPDWEGLHREYDADKSV